MKPYFVLLLEKFPWEKNYIIRVVIPGIDRGSAVWLETGLEQKTAKAAERMRVKIEKALNKT